MFIFIFNVCIAMSVLKQTWGEFSCAYFWFLNVIVASHFPWTTKSCRLLYEKHYYHWEPGRETGARPPDPSGASWRRTPSSPSPMATNTLPLPFLFRVLTPLPTSTSSDCKFTERGEGTTSATRGPTPKTAPTGLSWWGGFAEKHARKQEDNNWVNENWKYFF